MMIDDMQEKIKKLLEVDPREYFTANSSKFECYFWNRDPNVKPLGAEKWQSMHVITSLIV